MNEFQENEINYNLDIYVKYMNIYNDLMHKYKTDDSIEYDEKDIMQICNQLYQHELLLAFNVDDISDSSVIKTIDKLYNVIQKEININELMNRITDEKMRFIINNNDKDFFLLLFSFDYFYLMHVIIKQFMLHKKTDITLLDELKNKFTNQ